MHAVGTIRIIGLPGVGGEVHDHPTIRNCARGDRADGEADRAASRR